MATAPAVQSRRHVLHTRGNWSPREDRAASAIWLAIFWVGTVAGFGTDFSRFLHENPASTMVVRVHAVVFSVWLFLITAQVLLVLRNRVAWHRALGWFCIGWACLMLVLGPWAAIAAQAAVLHTPFSDPAFLSVNIFDIAGFIILLAWGITLRKNPAAHKRMMILSTVALADPGFARFYGWLHPAEPTSIVTWFFTMFYGNLLLIGLMTAWDLWRGRLMRSFVIGAAALVASEFVTSFLYFWGPWKTLTTGLVEAWARHFA